MQTINDWENQFLDFVINLDGPADAAHDPEHIRRVVANAKSLGATEQANMMVVLPAAWLHDCVSYPKNSLSRHLASIHAAKKARSFLEEINYPTDYLADIEHAIESHSFSAGISPRTLEAKIVQDADRLDAIGAIGIARCFMVGGDLHLPVYDPFDPFAASRPPDDRQFIIDHFEVKLFKLEANMNTPAGKAEAQLRTNYMRNFLVQLRHEIGH